MIKLLEVQHHQIAELGSAIKVLADQTPTLHADTEATKIVAAVLIGEIAKTDRGYLDQLLARAIGRAEREVQQFSSSVRSAISAIIYEILTITKDGILDE